MDERYIVITSICIYAGAILAGSMPSPSPYFRSDYRYVEREQAFYKVHEQARTWRAARALCAAEGATLLYPETAAERTLLLSHLKEVAPSDSLVWVGAHDLFSESIFVKLNGEDLSSYAPWAAGEPNDSGIGEDCVAMTREGFLNDLSCEKVLPALCKKILATLTVNPSCQTSDLAYVPNPDKSRCYKIHLQPNNWSEAFGICHAEQSHLAIINDKKEADFLVQLMRQIDDTKIKVPYHKGHVGIGFHDIFEEGEYLTIHDETLEEANYTEWQRGQPDNYMGSENCGSITRSGLLNDINCNTRLLFICERNEKDPNVIDIHSRFQTD